MRSTKILSTKSTIYNLAQFLVYFYQIEIQMKKLIIPALLVLVSLNGFAQKNAKMDKTTGVKLESAKDTVSYSLGILIAKNLKNQGLDNLNQEAFLQAMNDVFQGKPTLLNDMQCQTEVQQYSTAQQKAKAEKNIAEGKAYLEKNKNKPGVITTASGLQYEVIKQGTGTEKPTAQSQVTAHYHGTLIDGTVFDSSVQRNQPFKTGVGQVIQAWQEALQLMTPGTKLRIVCPPNIAYGERGAGGAIGPNSVLIFEMELISIDKP